VSGEVALLELGLPEELVVPEELVLRLPSHPALGGVRGALIALLGASDLPDDVTRLDELELVELALGLLEGVEGVEELEELEEAVWAATPGALANGAASWGPAALNGRDGLAGLGDELEEEPEEELKDEPLVDGLLELTGLEDPALEEPELLEDARGLAAVESCRNAGAGELGWPCK